MRLNSRFSQNTKNALNHLNQRSRNHYSDLNRNSQNFNPVDQNMFVDNVEVMKRKNKNSRRKMKNNGVNNSYNFFQKIPEENSLKWNTGNLPAKKAPNYEKSNFRERITHNEPIENSDVWNFDGAGSKKKSTRRSKRGSNRGDKVDAWEMSYKNGDKVRSRTQQKKLENYGKLRNSKKIGSLNNDSQFDLPNPSRKRDQNEQVIGQKDHQKNMEIELEAQDAEFVDLIECRQCGRKFGRSAITKHSKICKKVFGKKRKKFDMKKKRLDTLNKQGAGKVQKTDASKYEDKAKWKKESENFRAMLRAGRKAERKGNSVAPNKNSQRGNKKGSKSVSRQQGKVTREDFTDGRMPCNICNDLFSEAGLQRHYPLCKSKNKYQTTRNKFGSTKKY